MIRRFWAVLTAFVLCFACAAAGAEAAAVTEAIPAEVYQVEPALNNPSPSPEAQALMDWMCGIYGRKIISGQYLDEYQYGKELEAVASVTGGLYPALVGMDLLNYSPSAVSLGSWPTSVDQAIGYWKKGYVVTFCWHWIAPERYLDTTGNAWWSGYRTESTTFRLDKVLSGEDPEGLADLERDLDAIAKQLTRLRDAGVPVLWRPLHEASGGWFWWGVSGPEAYIQLYRMMYEKFTGEYGLNNLIWVWNGQDKAWYPGDDVVDIIGEDVYPGKNVHEAQEKAFRRCLDYTDARKLIMLSECGCVPSPVRCEKDGVMWSAWAVWCYEFVLENGKYSEQYTSAERMQLFYGQENVVTLKDVPALGRTAGEAAEQPAAEETPDNVYRFADGELLGNVRTVPLEGKDWVELASNEETDGVTVTISVPEDGIYDLVIRQAGIGGYKENYLAVDGERIANTVVQGTDIEDCVTPGVSLTAGEHTVTVTCFWGWANLDSLTVVPSGK